MRVQDDNQEMGRHRLAKRISSLRALISLAAFSRRVPASPRLRVAVSPSYRVPTRTAAALVVIFALTSGGCFLDTEVEPYYGRSVAPRAQEFRWSDGGLPQVFDPALAAAPPDTDAVRAMFEGLTEYDPKTLAPVPGVAARWESSADAKEWIFYLRHDARWSNNDPVTAQDFVRSWQRTVQLGERAPHARLLENIVGVETPKAQATATPADASATPPASTEARRDDSKQATNKTETKAEAKTVPEQPALGVEALSDYVLRVRLQRPDPSFPSLVAHPVFRPVHDTDSLTLDGPASSKVVSNGAFQLTEISREGVVLERAKHYWDMQTVSLERVQFVATDNAEAALAAYRAGEVDAVTNASFEPLVLKLLAPYKDFRRATYGALTYYSFNTNHAPFGDVRIREALAIAIDRDRISQDELGGATEPAKKFLPVQIAGDTQQAEAAHAPAIERDIARAQGLLSAAGYPEGKGFPRVRLLINRNEQQRIVAQRIAAMWHTTLGIDTDVQMKNWDEYEAAVRAGDYDVVRRSVVMQTMDEATNLRAIFEMKEDAAADRLENSQPATEQSPAVTPEQAGKTQLEPEKNKQAAPVYPLPASEAQALKELPAMPIYFASSYALVKPYVTGFDSNLLDAPSLKTVRMNNAWQPPKKNTAAWFTP
jgi:oligopeptide transport system substrate-binding protein